LSFINNKKQSNMKKQVFTIVLISISGMVFGQCLPPTGHAFLDVNNVRARINVSMSSFWDEHGSAQYEVPKGEGAHAIFVGALWIGGRDEDDSVRVAATRFRQVGESFWPGPLNLDNGMPDPAECQRYDRVWKVNKWEVAELRERFDQADYTIPQDILEWPAHGNFLLGQATYLAPFVDTDGNGSYDPTVGDYPAFQFDNEPNMDFHLLGDQALWWVVNDQRNAYGTDIGGETDGPTIGVEIQNMAYAYNTCDFLNDQTFYRHKVLNRGGHTLYDTYMALWTDVDVGFAMDDYVGCDVGRGLGYGYNGLELDGTGGPTQYGAHPPAIGIDIFKGPLMSADGQDNDGDGTVDNEALGMSKFIYHNNNSTVTGDPQSSMDYYNYMRGIWKDNQPLCYGGNGHPNGGGDPNIPCDYMFPGDSDPFGIGTGGSPVPLWTEQTANNQPFDRRFMISSGPFTLEMGSEHSLHLGAVWARDATDASVSALQAADDLVQAAFDAKFQNLGCCPPSAAISYQHPQYAHFLFASIAEGQSYFWNFGDGHTSTDRFPTHTYTTGGSFQVCLTVTNACGSDSHCQTVNMSVGIADVEAATLGLTIHPNPSSSGFQVLLREGALVSIALTDALGRSILSPAVVGNVAIIPTEGLAPGIYFATVVTSNGTAVQRVVVQ